MPRPPLEFRSLTTVYLGGQSPGSWLKLSPETKFLKVDFQRSALPTFAIYSFSGVRPCKSKMFQSTIWFTSLGWWLIALKGKRRLSFALLIQGRSRAAEERSCACSFLGLPRSCSRAPAPCLFSSVRLRPLRFEHRSCFAPPRETSRPLEGAPSRWKKPAAHPDEMVQQARSPLSSPQPPQPTLPAQSHAVSLLQILKRPDERSTGSPVNCVRASGHFIFQEMHAASVSVPPRLRANK